MSKLLKNRLKTTFGIKTYLHQNFANTDCHKTGDICKKINIHKGTKS